MTPIRLEECLASMRWNASTLATAMGIPTDRVGGWMDGTQEIPTKVGSWIEALCFTHESAELLKPSLAELEREPARPIPPLEHIPSYSYGLLRQLHQDKVPLQKLFGTDDEAAVFFLVSRGLAERQGGYLTITSMGKKMGEVQDAS